MKKYLALSTIALLALVAGIGAAGTFASGNPHGDKVTICHRTGSGSVTMGLV